MKSTNKIKYIILLLILITQLNFTFAAAEDAPEYFKSNPNIKVGLIFGNGAAASFQTTATDGFIIGEVRADEPDVFYAVRYITENKIAVTRKNAGLAVINPDNGGIIYEYANSENNLAIIAAKAPQYPFKFNELSSQTTGFTASPAKNIYSGAFIYRASGNGVEVINLVSLEDYIKGVVPYEISPNWETEALRAFSIAARTYAIHKIEHSKHESAGFDICNAVHCQLFIGLKNATEKTNAAIDDTRDLILTYENKVIEAVYHSSSGGATENHNDAWSGGEMLYPYLASVQLPFENYMNPNRKNAKWTNSASPQELYEYLIKESAQSSLFAGKLNAPIAEIKINRRSPGSNYIRSISIKDINGNIVDVETSDRIRSVFGKYANSANMDIFKPGKFKAVIKNTSEEIANIDIESGQTYIMSANGLTKSAPNQLTVMTAKGLLAVQPYETGTNFVFDGKGWGHGVGMSQWATQDMALLGYSYEKIVKTFYTGVSIEKMSDVTK